jgi:hypothetical protein
MKNRRLGREPAAQHSSKTYRVRKFNGSDDECNTEKSSWPRGRERRGTGARRAALPGDSRRRAAAQRCGPQDRGERGIARTSGHQAGGHPWHVGSLSDGPAPLSRHDRGGGATTLLSSGDSLALPSLWNLTIEHQSVSGAREHSVVTGGDLKRDWRTRSCRVGRRDEDAIFRAKILCVIEEGEQ